ncbi:MAG: DNA glycosylase [Verrucomicrobiota bacterium]|nr:DNA glycosylase [Verrucomicrobiota bacterium]MDP7179222.1 DNA glycosylase [Verrucomicrobiota bacterium]MEE1545499.1 DNA glycosylase [Alphaproteobacteria bacterium]
MGELSKTFPVRNYDLDATLASGQAFCWQSLGQAWEGVIGKRWVRLRMAKGSIAAEVAYPVPDWAWLEDYLQLHIDLGQVLATFPDDEPMRNAVAALPGLRLLRQDYWECLASFILSATKQIVQIRQMVALLSERFGEPIESGGNKPTFAFPSIEAIAACSEAELRECKLGFRAPNLRGAARDILDEKIEWQRLPTMTSSEARAELMKLRGVGQKIADCVLLYAGGHQDVFPVDVWIDRALKRLYFPKRRPSARRLRKFADTHFGPYAGYAQQYLFHHARVHLKLK